MSIRQNEKCENSEIPERQEITDFVAPRHAVDTQKELRLKQTIYLALQLLSVVNAFKMQFSHGSIFFPSYNNHISSINRVGIHFFQPEFHLMCSSGNY